MANQTTQLLDVVEQLIAASNFSQLAELRKISDHQLLKEAWQLLSEKQT